MTVRCARSIATVALLPCLFVAEGALAQAEQVRTPITDSRVLARLGIPPSARTVYATEQGYAGLFEGSARGVAGGPSAAFGENLEHTQVRFSDFDPLRSSTEFSIGNVVDRYCVSGSPFFDAALTSLPSNVAVRRLDLISNDDSEPEDLEIFLLETCRPNNEGPVVTLLASLSSLGSGGVGQAAILFDKPPITNRFCNYAVRVRLDGGTTTCSETSQLGIIASGVRWTRVVSPAPATATFDDVPTGHPFFRFVEALAESGITSGCDGDSFCPGSPLTRGQMAVFLSKALGL